MQKNSVFWTHSVASTRVSFCTSSSLPFSGLPSETKPEQDVLAVVVVVPPVSAEVSSSSRSAGPFFNTKSIRDPAAIFRKPSSSSSASMPLSSMQAGASARSPLICCSSASEMGPPAAPSIEAAWRSKRTLTFRICVASSAVGASSASDKSSTSQSASTYSSAAALSLCRHRASDNGAEVGEEPINHQTCEVQSRIGIAPGSATFDWVGC
mmetsp:Transcript_101967/g.195723  ORF Transcript_101967/g.195723 Transcript_101967/m.195723 type:complete len:210 (-) Transcript_101967:2080-2709(-)